MILIGALFIPILIACGISYLMATIGDALANTAAVITDER